jgi:hypothetical protein
LLVPIQYQNWSDLKNKLLLHVLKYDYNWHDCDKCDHVYLICISVQYSNANYWTVAAQHSVFAGNGKCKLSRVCHIICTLFVNWSYLMFVMTMYFWMAETIWISPTSRCIRDVDYVKTLTITSVPFRMLPILRKSKCVTVGFIFYNYAVNPSRGCGNRVSLDVVWKWNFDN